MKYDSAEFALRFAKEIKKEAKRNANNMTNGTYDYLLAYSESFTNLFDVSDTMREAVEYSEGPMILFCFSTYEEELQVEETYVQGETVTTVVYPLYELEDAPMATLDDASDACAFLANALINATKHFTLPNGWFMEDKETGYLPAAHAGEEEYVMELIR